MIACSVDGHSPDNSFWEKFIRADIEKLNLDQYDNDNFEKVYRIWNFYQVIELVQRNDSVCSGKLVNYVTKTSRKTEKNKIIKEELEIPSSTVKALIDNLGKSNIENLPDCESIDGYVSGLDGTTYIFEIQLNDSKRIYSFWEPMSDYYQNDSIKEVNDVRSIISNLQTEINPGLHFKNFIDKLDKGSYNYNGTNMIKFK
jgi:hypothetical protein